MNKAAQGDTRETLNEVRTRLECDCFLDTNANSMLSIAISLKRIADAMEATEARHRRGQSLAGMAPP